MSMDVHGYPWLSMDGHACICAHGAAVDYQQSHLFLCSALLGEVCGARWLAPRAHHASGVMVCKPRTMSTYVNV